MYTTTDAWFVQEIVLNITRLVSCFKSSLLLQFDLQNVQTLH
jgi:hypothetical protein